MSDEINSPSKTFYIDLHRPEDTQKNYGDLRNHIFSKSQHLKLMFFWLFGWKKRKRIEQTTTFDDNPWEK